jgi:hypothetical protein
MPGKVVFPRGDAAMSNDRQLSTDVEIVDLVTARNRLREQFGLPRVEPQQELDRLHQVRERRAFEQWMQSGGGWAFHAALVKQMRKLRARLSDQFTA